MMERFAELKQKHPILFWGMIGISFILFVVIVRGSASKTTTTSDSANTDTDATSEPTAAELQAQTEEYADALAAQVNTAANTDQLQASVASSNTALQQTQSNNAASVQTAQIKSSAALAQLQESDSYNLQVNAQDQNNIGWEISDLHDIAGQAYNASKGAHYSGTDASVAQSAIDAIEHVGNYGT